APAGAAGAAAGPGGPAGLVRRAARGAMRAELTARASQLPASRTMTRAGPASAVTPPASAGPIIKRTRSAQPKTEVPATPRPAGSRSAISVYLPATPHADSSDDTPSSAT